MELSLEEKFERYLNELTTGLFNAKYQSRLYWKIDELIQEYNWEINKSNAFWGTVSESLKESSLLSLARVYDKNKHSINLKSFLDLIDLDFIDKGENISQAENNQRSQGNSLSEARRSSLESQLIKDKSLVEDSEGSIVRKLTFSRDRIIAHKDKRMISKDKNSIDLLTWNEFYQLVSRGFEIRNRYSILYGGSNFSADSLVGKDDYQSVFQHLRIADLTLDFANMKFPSLTSENCMEAIEDFIGEIKQETYKEFS